MSLQIEHNRQSSVGPGVHNMSNYVNQSPYHQPGQPAHPGQPQAPQYNMMVNSMLQTQMTGAMAPMPQHPVVAPPPATPQAVASRPAAPPAPPVEEAPLYVNAKQYHRILKRRETRQKLEAMQKNIKKEKAGYVHESRHKHAMRRPRGPGGRFLSSAERAALEAAEAAKQQAAAGGGAGGNAGGSAEEMHHQQQQILQQQGGQQSHPSGGQGQHYPYQEYQPVAVMGGPPGQQMPGHGQAPQGMNGMHLVAGGPPRA
ncbi:Transcriptional activator [Phlyctochytrium bullatum]|nr:Transcriptional activator [Phlyctochytrium bullatum]